LEDQLRDAKKDVGGIREFKGCVKKARIELEEIATDMYTYLHVFQKMETHIMDQHSLVQTKNV